MDVLKFILFIVSAPLATVIVCKLIEAVKMPSASEVARAKAAAQAARQDAMTAAVAREALRQGERSELSA